MQANVCVSTNWQSYPNQQRSAAVCVSWVRLIVNRNRNLISVKLKQVSGWARNRCVCFFYFCRHFFFISFLVWFFFYWNKERNRTDREETKKEKNLYAIFFIWFIIFFFDFYLKQNIIQPLISCVLVVFSLSIVCITLECLQFNLLLLLLFTFL